MTIQEARNRYGVKSYITNSMDTLTKIVDNLYNDRSFVYYYVITELNPHVNWIPYDSSGSTLLPFGIEVLYLPKEACQQVYEVVG